MGWFRRQLRGGRTERALLDEQARHLRAAGVPRALEAFAGPFGVRRFVVRFEHRGGGARVTRVDAVPLRWGGGPPPEDPSGERRRALEQALGRLWRNMSVALPWERGAIAYLRDARGRSEIVPTFDEDADAARLDTLRVPAPPGHPLELPETVALLARWAPAAARLRERTEAVSPDWDEWEVRDDRLLLLRYGVDAEGRAAETMRARCRTLATFEPDRGWFTWRTDGPLFPEDVYSERSFPADFDSASSLALATAARLDARWLFVQPVEPRAMLLMVAVFE